MLLVPLAMGLAAGQIWDPKALFLTLTCLALFFAHRPLSILVKAGSIGELSSERLRKPVVWSLVYLFLTAACAAPLFLIYGLWDLLYLAAGGLAIMALQLLHYSRREQLSLRSELLGAAGLTLSGPAAYYAATGHMDRVSFVIYLLAVLYFWGEVLYVRARVAIKIRGETEGDLRERLIQGKGTLLYHVVLTICGFLLNAGGYVPLSVAGVSALLLLKSIWGVAGRGAPASIRKMGFVEAAYSAAFGAVMIVVFGWR